MGCCGVYPDVLWWVGGFSLDVRTHHVQRILKINSNFSGYVLFFSLYQLGGSISPCPILPYIFGHIFLRSAECIQITGQMI